jgi:hypothetical protein
MLRQTTDVNAHRSDLVEDLDAVLRQHVHHPWRKAAIGNDGASGLPGPLIEPLLLKDDLGVAAQVAEVRPGVRGHAGEIEIEVVGNRAHRGVSLTHEGAHRLVIADVEMRGDEATSRVRREEIGKMVDPNVGEPYLRDVGVLEQIVGARGPLQSRTEHEHVH